MDGFLRPDTPLLCIHPLPPCCVGDGFLSVRYPFVVFLPFAPLLCRGWFSLGLYCLLRDVLHGPHSYSVSFATRLIRICNAMKNLYMR